MARPRSNRRIGTQQVSLTELQINTRRNLTHTLLDMASIARQKSYKANVPYVHVPIERLAQWDEYSLLLQKEIEWFVIMFDEPALAALHTFDESVRAYTQARNGDVSDVPDVHDDPDWLGLGAKAEAILTMLSAKS